MDSRDTLYFRDMALRVYRALQFLKAQPEWNQKVLIVSGGSQGGAQSLMAAGLDPQVTTAIVNVPAVCDHGGASIGRESGWPRFSNTPTYRKNPKKYLPLLDYVDCVNFASRIKAAKVFMTTGTIDTTCVPSSVCAAFNAIPSKDKKLVIELNMPHRVNSNLYNAINKIIDTEMKKK
jgi:cephalosporin-C deacetylase-like acetyl esterase